MLVLPSDQRDQWLMLWLTKDFQPMVNGSSGFTPASQKQVQEVTKNFPDPASIDLLRQLGVKSVVVLKEEVRGTPYEGALTTSVAGLGIQREERSDAIIFKL